MGSFQITYADFTGGHYMGNRETEQPSNTWTGTNTTLDPRGNLIATAASLRVTLAGPAYTLSDDFWINGFFSHENALTVCWTFSDASPSSTVSYIRRYNLLTSTWSSTFTLAGNPSGFMAPDQSAERPILYYTTSTGNIYKLEFTSTSWTETLVSSGTNVTTSLYKYKYRLLGIGVTGSIRNRLYYSNTTLTAWGATDYYEFPGQITNVAPRTNDFIVTTTAGIYSVTGVLGESVNIQEIYTFEELSQGMSNPVTYGRDFVYLNDYLDTQNGKIYAGLGATKTLIGTLDLDAIAPLNIGLANPGLITVMSENGYIYILNNDGAWMRGEFPDWDPNDQRIGGGGAIPPGYAGTAAITLRDLPGDMYLAQPLLKPYVTDITDAVAYVARIDFTDIKIYQITHTRKDPATVTASVILSDYWHQKPMVVREVIVESEYISGGNDGSVAVNIIPVGAVDISAVVASTMTSSTITGDAQMPTPGVSIIQRFFVNNAGRAYGFKPQITHKGVRIRRVICICED